MGAIDVSALRPSSGATSGAAAHGGPYQFTFGVYNQTSPWSEVRSLIWADLVRLLTSHETGAKEGRCLVPAMFRGTERKKAEADCIDVAFLDSDTGATLREIREAVSHHGWAAIISSTHSHLTTTTRVKRTQWEKFCTGIQLLAEAPAAFLKQEKGYLKRIAAGAAMAEETAEYVTFRHQPCPKFRIAIPLERPWRAANYADQDTANTAWKERIEALAAALQLDHDQACTDTSRLFYLPRRPSDGPPPETAVVDGVPCDLFALASAGAAPAHSRRTADMIDLSVVDPETGKVFDLKQWARDHAGQFEIVDALRARRPDLFNGRVAEGTKHHIRCVNDDAHSDPGADAATFILNASDSRSHGFVYHCRHAHCDGRDRLFFLRRMLERGWLTVADLTASAYAARSAEAKQADRPTYEDCSTAAEAVSPEGSPDDLTSVLHQLVAARLDAISNRRVLEILKQRTGVPLAELRTAVDEIRRESRGARGDVALAVANEALHRLWHDGRHLVRAIDKSFWSFTGTHWRRCTDEQVKHHLLAVVQDVVDPKERDFNSVLNASFNLLIASRAVSTDVLRLTGEPLPIINCRNGELWIGDDASVDLRPHRYVSHLTYVLDVAYDPGATCPEFDRALAEIFSLSADPSEMSRHYMEFMGYAIQPRRDIACYFMMKGQGNNGKTKLIETIEKLINARSMYSARLAEIEGNKFLIGALAGKLILLDDDIDDGARIPDGLLKKLSERKLLTGELKFKDSFEFVATCLPVLLANNYPLCTDLSYGQRRRANIIPFDRVFRPDEDDRGLFPRIWQHELAGILNRAIEGLQRLRRRGGFDEPADCIRARQEWLAHANPVVAFIEERCEPVLNSDLPLSPFYRAFTHWATESGIKNIPARNTLKANLINLGYPVRRTDKHSSVVSGLTMDAASPVRSGEGGRARPRG